MYTDNSPNTKAYNASCWSQEPDVNGVKRESDVVEK